MVGGPKDGLEIVDKGPSIYYCFVEVTWNGVLARHLYVCRSFEGDRAVYDYERLVSEDPGERDRRDAEALAYILRDV